MRIKSGDLVICCDRQALWSNCVDSTDTERFPKHVDKGSLAIAICSYESPYNTGNAEWLVLTDVGLGWLNASFLEVVE